MVLVSNEWKNNSNDDDKSTATATSTAEPSSPPAAATASEAETKSHSTSTTTTTTTTTTTISASLSKSVNGACMSTEPRETLKAATVALFEDTNVKALTPLIEDIEIGTATLTTRVVCENNPTHEFSEKTKHFYEDLKDKEKKKEPATITKATLDCFSSWHEASFVGKNYVKMAEPLKEPFDDEHYADKILEGDSFLKTTADTNNSFDMLLDREANFDSNSNTLLASNSCQITSRSKSPANVESVQNVVRPMLCGVTSLTAQIPPTRKLFNTNFSIGDNHTSKNDNNLSDVSTKTSCSDITTSTTNASAEPSTGQAKIVLLCETNSHPFQRRTIFLTPNVECMVGRLIAKSKAGENNAIFDCKVLSRKHAVIWYTPDGKFWVKDTKSSNGTFINDHKLGEAEAELHFDDIVKFGVDVLENSRKEVHGCVIACVKLYLPDGREAISIDAPGPYRGQYSGEDRISYDELNRLNLYIQETASREKLLTSKLCNIQSVLDATRKNSALCWQAMITEDQLLHRIHSLEKKLQLMEKNVPENALRNEVLKLMDDKSSYQLKTKEALRKMYQERNDAMQMFSKMESAYTESNNECSLLRDQIANSTQVLQDVNSRLMQLENEYSGYREESMRQQHEAKEREEQRIGELNEQLRKREVECDDLKRKLSAMCMEVLTAKQQQLENQAIEKLDAAIADVCLGDEEDIDEDDEPNKGDVGCGGGEQEQRIESVRDAVSIESTKLDVKPPIKLVKAKKTKHSPTIKEKSPPKRVKEATIMKWLQNSDINKKEGSVNIFKAICNENDSNSEDSSAGDEFAEKDVGRSTAKSTTAIDDEEDKEVHEHDVINMKCINFANKLKTVQKYLKQLEAEIENDTTRVKIGESNAQVDNECDDLKRGGSIVDGTVNELLTKQRNDNSKKVLSKDSKSYLLLTSSVNMLREAYNEITHSVALNEEEESEGLVENAPEQVVENDTIEKTYSQTSFTPANSSHVADQTLPLHKDRDHLLYIENGSNIGNTHNDGVSNCEVKKNTINIPLSLDAVTTFEMTHSESEPSLQQQLKEYQTQVEALSEKLERTELEAQQTLEIMQYECEETKKRVQDLTKAVQSLSEDKQALEKVITENNVNNAKTAADTAVDSKKTSTTPTSSLQHPSFIKDTTYTDVYYELNDTVNDDISQHSHLIQEIDNEPEFEREEELITYKERLEKQEQQNIQLRYEIDALKLKTNQLLGVGGGLVRTVIPCGAVALALFIYFLNTYF